MKLTYFQLLSSEPIYIPKVGGILSPKLKDISIIGDDVYHLYLSIVLMDAKMYFMLKDQKDVYENLLDTQKSNLDVYDLIIQDIAMALQVQEVLNFFIKEDVEYSPESECFFIKSNVIVKEQDEMIEKYEIVGLISKENYCEVVDVICQRNNIKSKDVIDPSKVKSKKALSILEKIKKGREKMAKTANVDENMELGNIISAVANRSQSLNMVNIWDLTVFQLWDCFARLTNNTVYDINAASVSAWGDKDKKFDFNGWFKKLNS